MVVHCKQSCIAYDLLVSCETLQSTTDIIVNLTSTAMGSNATYQCRDGSSDVYTTQCTSDGVWEPNPNSTLDCTTPGVQGVMQYCDYHMHVLFILNLFFLNLSFLVSMTVAALLIGLAIITVAVFAVGVVGVTIAVFLWSSRRKTSEKNDSYILLENA